MQTLERHYLSTVLGDLPEKVQADLKKSIEKIGVQTPIVLHAGQVLDGWHRYKLSQELGIQCPSRLLSDEIDPRDFVTGAYGGRHDSESVRAIKLAKIWEPIPPGENQHTRVRTPCAPSQKSASELAKIGGVSERLIVGARKIAKSATAPVIKAVESGQIGIKKAEAISKLPASEQEAAISSPLQKSADKSNGRSKQEAAKPEASQSPDAGPVDYDLQTDGLRDELSMACQELQECRDRLAAGFAGTTDEERAEAALLISELRSEISIKDVELNAIRATRASADNTINELIRQVRYLERRLKNCEKQGIQPPTTSPRKHKETASLVREHNSVQDRRFQSGQRLET